jgi:hypothetical protein
MMLNSFWGKFGQRSNMPQIKYISEPAEYIDMLTSDQILVMGINFVSAYGCISILAGSGNLVGIVLRSTGDKLYYSVVGNFIGEIY